MIKCICDKCGNEISFEKTDKFLENYIVVKDSRIDLCDDCYIKFVSWLNKESEDTTENSTAQKELNDVRIYSDFNILIGTESEDKE